MPGEACRLRLRCERLRAALTASTRREGPAGTAVHGSLALCTPAAWEGGQVTAPDARSVRHVRSWEASAEQPESAARARGAVGGGFRGTGTAARVASVPGRHLGLPDGSPPDLAVGVTFYTQTHRLGAGTSPTCRDAPGAPEQRAWGAPACGRAEGRCTRVPGGGSRAGTAPARLGFHTVMCSWCGLLSATFFTLLCHKIIG